MIFFFICLCLYIHFMACVEAKFPQGRSSGQSGFICGNILSDLCSDSHTAQQTEIRSLDRVTVNTPVLSDRGLLPFSGLPICCLPNTFSC